MEGASVVQLAPSSTFLLFFLLSFFFLFFFFLSPLFLFLHFCLVFLPLFLRLFLFFFQFFLSPHLFFSSFFSLLILYCFNSVCLASFKLNPSNWFVSLSVWVTLAFLLRSFSASSFLYFSSKAMRKSQLAICHLCLWLFLNFNSISDYTDVTPTHRSLHCCCEYSYWVAIGQPAQKCE